MNTLGDFIKRARKNKKLTLTQLGDMTGLTHGYLSNLENNVRKNPSMEVLKKLAQALDIEYSKLALLSGLVDEKTLLIEKLQKKLDEELRVLEVNKEFFSKTKDVISLLPKDEKLREIQLKENDEVLQKIIDERQPIIEQLKEQINSLTKYGVMEFNNNIVSTDVPRYENHISSDEKEKDFSFNQAYNKLFSLEYLLNSDEDIYLHNKKLTSEQKKQLFSIAETIFRN